MNYNQFSNLSCYEEFEIQCDLRGISKINILKKFGDKTNNYYFFISNDGIFNWYELEGNHIKDPGVLKEIKEIYIPKKIAKCIIPDGVTYICSYSFFCCESLKEIALPNSITSIGNGAFERCKTLESITIPNNVRNIGDNTFYYCESLEEVIFKGKTLDEVKKMRNYPFRIKDKKIIKSEI